MEMAMEFSTLAVTMETVMEMPTKEVITVSKSHILVSSLYMSVRIFAPSYHLISRATSENWSCLVPPSSVVWKTVIFTYLGDISENWSFLVLPSGAVWQRVIFMYLGDISVERSKW